jgi:hypothetical protein
MAVSRPTDYRTPFCCVQCTRPLPFTLAHRPEGVSLACAYCGQRYRGVPWIDPPPAEELRGGIVILPDAPRRVSPPPG